MPPDNHQPPTDHLGIALREIGEASGWRTSDARLLRQHTWHTYLLPSEGVVIRLAPASDETLERATVSARVTGWLSTQGFPSVRPLTDTPLQVGNVTVTAWHYLPQLARTNTLPVAALGALLRELHSLPEPPFPLPAADPFSRLRRTLNSDAAKNEPTLTGTERRFIDERASALQAAYQVLDFPLGFGLIHNDAHIGNLLVAEPSPHGYVLADWDGAAYGPREIDLVQEGAPGNRFGLPEQARLEFSTSYGYDLAEWSGWRVLRDIRDLYSIGAYLRAAPHKPAARAELHFRIETLQWNDGTRPWSAIK